MTNTMFTLMSDIAHLLEAVCRLNGTPRVLTIEAADTSFICNAGDGVRYRIFRHDLAGFFS